MRFIGIDLGTTFIKGAVLCLDDWGIRQVERLPFPEPITGLRASFREFDPAQIVTTARALLERLLRYAPDAEGIVCCSQLHGRVFTTEEGRAVSILISWQDQRALESAPSGGGTYFDEVNRRITPEERRELGNEPRPGAPLVSFIGLPRTAGCRHSLHWRRTCRALWWPICAVVLPPST